MVVSHVDVVNCPGIVRSTEGVDGKEGVPVVRGIHDTYFSVGRRVIIFEAQS